MPAFYSELFCVLKECDSKKNGHLDFPGFQKFVKILQRRPDLETIYGRLSSANGGKFDLAAFVKFMRESQKVLEMVIDLQWLSSHLFFIYSLHYRTTN